MTHYSHTGIYIYMRRRYNIYGSTHGSAYRSAATQTRFTFSMSVRCETLSNGPSVKIIWFLINKLEQFFHQIVGNVGIFHKLELKFSLSNLVILTRILHISLHIQKVHMNQVNFLWNFVNVHNKSNLLILHCCCPCVYIYIYILSIVLYI